MASFLGETKLNQKDVEEFKDFDKNDWAMYFVERYGQFDGSHHKAWVLDQVARILKGSKVIIKIANWDDGGFEYRCEVDKPSKEYKKWVKEMLGSKDEDGEYEYGYDEGIAP